MVKSAHKMDGGGLAKGPPGVDETVGTARPARAGCVGEACTRRSPRQGVETRKPTQVGRAQRSGRAAPDGRARRRHPPDLADCRLKVGRPAVAVFRFSAAGLIAGGVCALSNSGSGGRWVMSRTSRYPPSGRSHTSAATTQTWAGRLRAYRLSFPTSSPSRRVRLQLRLQGRALACGFMLPLQSRPSRETRKPCDSDRVSRK